MTNIAVDTDVLIVGAGPVGLFLANECARRGLGFRIIEEHPSQSEHSKALAIFPRTLEIFDMAGVVPPFLAVANRVTSVAVMTHERTLAHMRFAPEESPYSFNLRKTLTKQIRQRTSAKSTGTAEGADGIFLACEYEAQIFHGDGKQVREKAEMARKCHGRKAGPILFSLVSSSGGGLPGRLGLGRVQGAH